jgi:hypothetical protein
MNRPRRTALLIDRQVQGVLLLRIILYWMFCFVSLSAILICWEVFTGPSQRMIDLISKLYFRYGPVLSASFILLPIVLLDVIRVSNRFVGPIARLRQGLSDVADGRPAQPLNFRDDDFWRDLASNFNRAVARVARETSERSSPTEEMPQPEHSSSV